MDAATTSATVTSPKLTKKPSLGDIRLAGLPTRSIYGCEHVKGLLENARPQALEKYTRLIQTIRNGANIAPHIPKSTSSITHRATYLCLQCPNVATSEDRGQHKKDHLFSVESSHGYLYCNECRDFVYDPTFEEIRTQSGKKRKLSAYISDVDSKLISANSLANPCRARGLRGLYNMGQTCFMSVVLQSLIHNPFIRAYYLAESHRSSDCERESCTSCALDDIFTEFHSVEKAEGYGAVAMLQASWKGGGSLAGYQQQDAHEYLQFILNSLHSANTEDEEKENQKAEDCDCVIHQTFCGLLRSTVTCSKCKNVTTAVDPFMDLSLDLKDQNNKPTNHSVKKKLDFGGKDGKDGKANSANGAGALAIELTECLDRFTSAEALLATDYKCTACDSQQNATKRMSLSRLPPVLPIHLKRFSHSKSSSSSVKLDDRVKYPTTLDLRPYTSKKNPSKNSDKKSEANGAPANGKVEGGNGGGFAKPIYELSSVIVHKGKMDSGHYVSYARIEDEWFLFDDSKVVLVDEREVLNTEPYMLFYIIREFDAE